MKHLGAKIVVLSALVLALVLAMAPARGGLGLGEARVESFLGQPLSTRISLLEPSEQALDTLSVEIASADDHARLGVPSDALGLGLRIDVDRRSDPPALRLSSTRPINEPFVQVLVSARWSGGRMLREYTLFLDPPTVPVAPPLRRIGESAAAPVTAVPRSDPPSAAAEPEPSPPAPPVADRGVETSPRVAERVPERSAPALSTVGPVSAGQTLWSIAEAWRPDDSVSMNQVLMAILERNPQAFANHNINRLMLGAELVMPDMAAVRAVPQDQAQRRVREQNAAWQAERDRLRVTPSAPATVVEPVPALAEPEPTVTREPEPVAAPEPEPAPATPVDAEIESGPAEDSTAVASGLQPETDEVSLPRLELTAADDALLADSQALGAEREQLEERLESLVQALRSDGLDTPSVDAEVDQIRQAIASNDAGGLMIASEGLAELEQQMRATRAQREAEAAAAAAEADANAVVPLATSELGADQPAIFRYAWLLGALLLALLLALAAAVTVFRRRRAAAQTAAVPVAAAVTPAPAPRERREPNADSLDAGLAELYRLAEDEDHEAFGSALSDFHAQLDSTADPRWREAMTLARVLVPGHPLLRNTDEKEPVAADSLQSEQESESGLEALLADPAEDRDPRAATASESDFEDDEDDGLKGLLDEQDETAEDADISSLANRLDPNESGQARKRAADSEDDALADLFREAPAATPTWQLEAEDEGPLTLDFDFSSRREAPAAEDSGTGTPPAEDRQTDSASIEDLAKRPDEQLQDQLSDHPHDELDEQLADLENADDAEPSLDPDFDAPLSDEELLSAERDWFDLGDELDDEDESELDDEIAEGRKPDAELGPMQDDEHVATLSDDDAEVKLDLARAYLSMDDTDSARSLLEEVIKEGSERHRTQAQQLIEGLK
ncbi:MAG: FimV/HubP family polar landmark protein [Wenzhouxiangella sp.]